MNRLNLIQKLEDAISSLKDEVEKNDGSTLSTIANTVKSGVDSVSDSIMNNKTTQSFVDTFKKHMNEFEDAVLKSDKKLSSKAISAMHKGVLDLKYKVAKEDDSPAIKPQGIYVQYQPNRSKVMNAGVNVEAPNAKPIAINKDGRRDTSPIFKFTGKSNITPMVNKSTVMNANVAQKVPVAKPTLRPGAKPAEMPKGTAAPMPAAKPKAPAKAKEADKPKAAAKPTAKPAAKPVAKPTAKKSE